MKPTKTLKSDKYKFVRYGILNPRQKQKVHVGNYVEPSGGSLMSFHIAPKSRGFYAFPFKLQELYLISGSTEYQKDVLPFKKLIPELPEDEQTTFEIAAAEYRKNIPIKQQNEKILKENFRIFYKTNGTIWHHLIDATPHCEVIEKSGTWIRTSMEAWYKALGKNKVNLFHNDPCGSWQSDVKFSKDHYEVFIDEKVS